MMKPRLILTAPLAASMLSLATCWPALAQSMQAAQPTSPAPCIFAGRINEQGHWAPLASGLTLLNAAGQPLPVTGKPELESAKTARLSQSAWLAKCNGNQALPSGDASQGSKSPAPVVSAGSTPIPITAVAYAPGRAGGKWVELQLNVPQERVSLR